MSARRITCALTTLFTPSVNATAPAAFSKPISASSVPSSPLVSAAIGCTCTMAVALARRSTKSTIAGSSITGLVSGWHTMVVTPPAAAGWLAGARGSRDSARGGGLARGRQRLAVLGPRLADEGAHVDEPRRNQTAVAVDDFRALGDPG